MASLQRRTRGKSYAQKLHEEGWPGELVEFMCDMRSSKRLLAKFRGMVKGTPGGINTIPIGAREALSKVIQELTQELQVLIVLTAGPAGSP